MRNQEQPKDSNWYNNRFVLTWLLIGIYILVPVFFTIWGYHQWHQHGSSLSEILEWLATYDKNLNRFFVGYLAIALLFAFFLAFWINSSEKEKVRIKLLNSILRGHHDKDVAVKSYRFLSWAYLRNLGKAFLGKNDVSPAIVTAIESIITKTGEESINGLVTKTTTDSLNKILNESIGKCINGLKIKMTENGSIVEKSFQDALENIINEALAPDNLKKIMSEALKEETVKNEIKDAVNNAFPKSIELSDEIKEKVLKETLLEKIKAPYEIEAQKYRFAERVVGEICKNNKPNADDIAQIRNLIGDVFGANHQCCCLDIIEDANKYIFEITDMNSKKLRLFNYKMSDKMYVSSPNGSFILRNGIIIEIQGNMIQSVTKKEDSLE